MRGHERIALSTSRVGSIACALAALLVSPRAHAGGVEATVVGARAIGRGGAMVSSATGLDALRFDPARLATGERMSIAADVQLHATRVCFDRAADDRASSYPRVCNETPRGMLAQVGATFRIGSRIGLGIGILPPGGTPGLRFGDATDGTIAVDGQRVASPARNANVVTDNFALFSTVGIGATVHPKLRVGATFGWGVITATNVSFTAAVPGSGPTNDVRTGLGARDLFVPRVSLGLDFEPIEGLGISAVTTWTDDLRADASLFLSGESGGGFSTRVDGVHVTQAFGWEQTVGIRYARPRWDLELDVMLQAHARTQQIVVDIPDDATLPVSSTINGAPLGNLPDERRVERRWKNQLVARFGGEGEVIEDRLSLRGGVSYESNGVDLRYLSVENFLVRRVGVHLGVGLRVHRSVALHVGYAHIFQPTTTVALADARVAQPVAAMPGNTAGEVVYVNGGTYRGGIDVVALSIVFVRPDPAQETSR